VLLAYVWRRHDAKGLIAGSAAALAALSLVALPHVLGGGARAMMASYFGAADNVPIRSSTAYNGWFLLDRFDDDVRDLPPLRLESFSDATPVLGPLTYKHLGILAFTAYVLFLMATVWRRPSRHILVLAAALSVFGFFLLLTQMHERYSVPAAALLALAAPLSPRVYALFVGVSATAALNQILVQLGTNLAAAGRLNQFTHESIQVIGSLTALANIVLFFRGTRLLWQDAVARPADAPGEISSNQTDV
jgi:hypothetical protein